MSIDEQVPRSDAATPKDDTDLDKEDFYELRDDEFTLEVDDNVTESTISSAPPPLPPWAAESRSLLAATREDDSTVEVDQPASPLRAEAPSELSAREKLKRLVQQVIAREIYVKEVERALNHAIGRGHGQAFRIAELELELREVHAQLTWSEQARVALESQAVRDRELAAMRKAQVVSAVLASHDVLEPPLDATAARENSVADTASIEEARESAFAWQVLRRDIALSRELALPALAARDSVLTVGPNKDMAPAPRRRTPEAVQANQLHVAQSEAARTARLPKKSARTVRPPKKPVRTARADAPRDRASSSRTSKKRASIPKATPTPDDLSKIAGIGVRTIAQLHKLGITSFARIASWTRSDVSRVARRLATSPARIQREDWIGQAGALSKARKQRKAK